MSIVGNLLFAWEHWVKTKANESELVKELRRKVLSLSETEDGRKWLDGLTAQFGEPVAIQPLKMLRGLPEYPKQSFWQYVFHIGTPMDLVITRTHLLFFDPMFKPEAKVTPVSKDQVRRTSINYGDGSQLHVKTRNGLIRCEVGPSLAAKPIWGVIEEVFFGRRNVR